MNAILKRIGTGLLALLMVFSLVLVGLPTDTFAATGSYTYNTGTRHDYNTSMSAQAMAYYTGSYSWENLSVLKGSSTGSCTDMSTPLFQALHNLMDDTMTNSVSYSSLPDYWKYTDASGGSNTYILFYKDVMGPDSSMNREHVWPNSHGTFDKSNGGCDLHHLRPTNGSYNSSRGNLIMGNVRGVYSSYSKYPTSGDPAFYKTSSIVEVNDNIKGDVARILLYVWCRWEEPNLFTNTGSTSGSDGGKVIESLNTLLEWCEIDPVDTWEIGRNDQIEKIQGNRNVFIDYPEFAWLIFGRDVPENYNTPSGNAGSSVPECTNHKWVAATCTQPKTCSVCKVTEGSALGHTWITANCLNPKTCSVCGTTSGTTTDHLDKDNNKVCDTCGKDLSAPSNPGGVAGTYVQITSKDEFTTGQYVMIADKGYGPGVYSNGWLTAVKPIVDGTVVTDAQGGVWTLTVSGTSVTLKDANGVLVKPKSGNNNGITNGTYNWAWSFDANKGTFTFNGVGSDTTLLASNVSSGNQFRSYKKSTVSGSPSSYPSNFKLYKLVKATHEHSYTSTITTKPTCTSTGIETYTCSCGDKYTKVVDALKHEYVDIVTDPTCTTGGFTTYICEYCEDEYESDRTAALGHTYDDDADADCNVCGATREIGPAVDANLKFLAAPGLSFQDYIGMQVLVPNTTANKYDRIWVEAVQADPAGDVTTTLEAVPYFGVYQLFEQQILSWSMTEEVTLTLYAEKDGKTYVGQTVSASVENLALDKIASYDKQGNAKAVKALVDMVNYGAAVQVAFNHNASNLPNKNLGNYADKGTTTTPEFNASNNKTGTGKVSVLKDSISMQAKVEVQLLFAVDISAYTVKATVGGEDAPVVIDTETMGAYGWTLVRVAIGAAKMRDNYTIALYDANGNAVTQVYEVSVEAYGAPQLGGTYNDVVIAMMRYGDSVAAI